MATTPAKKPAAKPAAAKTATKATAKPPAKALPARAEPKAEKLPKPERAPKPEASKPTAGATLKARDLIARVAEATGGKVKDIKPMVEATLAELGKALDAGETLVLPPLGKLRITPPKGEGATGPMKLKLNRGGAAGGRKNPEKEALAEGGEDS